MTAPPLPNFEAPPINEVVLGVQSDRLNLATPFLGLYWARIRERYPSWEVHAALEPAIERFGDAPQTITPFGFKVMERPETPRCWFIDHSGNHLVQLQQDRLIHNWRRRNESDEYPRYSAVRAGFVREYEQLDLFLKEAEGSGCGELAPQWCEVTYVNHMPRGFGWNGYGDLGQVFVFFSSPAGGFLPSPEAAVVLMSYKMEGEGDPQPFGRLHVAVKPAVRRQDNEPLLVFELTARGRPQGDGLDGVLKFMDSAHECVVRGFASLTQPAMHRLWGRRDA